MFCYLYKEKKHDYFASVFEIKEHVCTAAFMRTTFVFHFVFLFNLFFPRWWDRKPKYYACHVLSRYRQIWHKHLPQSQCNRSSLLQTQLRSFLSLYFCLNFLTQAQALACCEITINARARVAIQKPGFCLWNKRGLEKPSVVMEVLTRFLRSK